MRLPIAERVGLAIVGSTIDSQPSNWPPVSILSSVRIRAPFPFVLLLACGPTTTVPIGSDDTLGSTTAEPPSITVTTGMATTMRPDETSVGPLDTSDSDAGAPWLDLPEYCSTIEQDCPRGYKCTSWDNSGGRSWNAHKCVPIATDPNGVGEPCTMERSVVSGIDDCDGASMCWNVDPKTLEGTCVPFCIGSEDDPGCAEPCDLCVVTSEGVLTLCVPHCDPIIQDCPSGQGCYYSSHWGFGCGPDVAREGVGIGSACQFDNACPAGMACVDSAADPGCDQASFGCCAPYCTVGGADPCPGLFPGTECAPWFRDGDPDRAECFAADPGVCVAPSP